MRTYDEISAAARDGRAFSNSTEFELWADQRGGCWTCSNDDQQAEKYCPILTVALQGVTPAEWATATEEDARHSNYTCAEYDERPDDDGPDDGDEPEPDPGPPPVIDGQVDMFEVFVDQGIAELPAPVRTGAIA